MVDQPTAVTDRTCVACEERRYSVGRNEVDCTDWRDCPKGFVISEDGTPTTNVECVKCEASYTESINSRECLQHPDCEVGNRVSTPALFIQPRTCAPVGQLEFTDRINMDRGSAHTVCQPGQYVSVASTPSTDRVCLACPKETWSG